MNRLKINVVTLKEDEYLIRDSIRFENCSYLQLLIDYEDIATILILRYADSPQ